MIERLEQIKEQYRTLTLLDEVNNTRQLDLSLDDLGRNVQRLKKGSGGRLQTGGTGGDVDIAGGNDSGLGSGGHAKRSNVVSHAAQISVGEDEADVSAKNVHEGFELGVSGFDVLTNALAHQGVLSQKHLSLSAVLLANTLKMVGTDIVDGDDQNLGIRLQVSRKKKKTQINQQPVKSSFFFFRKNLVKRSKKARFLT